MGPVVWKEPRKVERSPAALRSVAAVPRAEVSAEGSEMSPKLCCAMAVTCIPLVKAFTVYYKTNVHDNHNGTE